MQSLAMSPTGALRVVIADDAPAMRSLLRQVIDESTAFRVVGEAADGEEAVRLAADQQPDVVLLDLAMPVLDGMGAIPRIRASSPGSRIVVLSGFGAGRMAQRAYDQGADAYVEKREPVEDLLARLTEVAAGGGDDLYQTAFEHAPIGMAIEPSAGGGGAVRVNDAYRRITGGGSSVRITCHGPITYVEELTDEQPAEIRHRIEADTREELARANAELAHFASVAAHELRSPLQVISGFASVLERSQADRLDERGRECVQWIVDGAARLDTLIDDLLAFARVGAGRAVREPVDLGTLVDADDARVTHDYLPTVVGDPHLLRQLLQNLIGNGCKFVAPGTAPHVHVSAERLDGGWQVSVADNGVGVAAAQRDEIFEMFRRLHGREQYDGAGVGLAICQRIVDGHGGRIWVDPNPGGGSVFRFTIPDPPAGGPATALESPTGKNMPKVQLCAGQNGRPYGSKR